MTREGRAERRRSAWRKIGRPSVERPISGRPSALHRQQPRCRVVYGDLHGWASSNGTSLTHFTLRITSAQWRFQLRNLKTEARNLARPVNLPPRWPPYDQMLAANPLDGDSRGRSATSCFSSATGRAPSRSSGPSAMHDVARGTSCRRWSAARCSSRSARTRSNRGGDGAQLRPRRPDAGKVRRPAAPVDLDAQSSRLAPPPSAVCRSWCLGLAPGPSISRCSSSTRSSSYRSPSSPSCRPSCFRPPCGCRACCA